MPLPRHLAIDSFVEDFGFEVLRNRDLLKFLGEGDGEILLAGEPPLEFGIPSGLGKRILKLGVIAILTARAIAF